MARTVGPRVGEQEPVSGVELRQQAVLHHLVQVVPGRTPQAAAEQRSILGGLLPPHNKELWLNNYSVTQRNLHPLEVRGPMKNKHGRRKRI